MFSTLRHPPDLPDLITSGKRRVTETLATIPIQMSGSMEVSFIFPKSARAMLALTSSAQIILRGAQLLKSN